VFPASAALVRRMEELGATLAGPRDVLLLSAPLDEDFQAYTRARDWGLPTVLVPERAAGTTSTAQAVLDSPVLLAELARLAEEGAWLMPMGTSPLEQRVAEVTGLRLAVPDSATFERVNSKIYGRRLAAGAGLREVPGECCESAGQLAEALLSRYPAIAEGRAVVVKDAYGVSGKGIVVVEDERRLDQLVRMVTRRAERTGDPRLAVVVEEWADKAVDLNYHFTVDRDGSVRFDFVKEAITDRGVHKGHRIPARISPAHHAEIVRCAELLGGRLAADGFYGVVGVDAIVTAGGGLLPVLEINARNNMSTYQTGLQEAFMDADKVGMARQYDLALTGDVGFAATRDRLGDLLFTVENGHGLLVNNFATVNAAATQRQDGRSYGGRLYGLLIAGSDQELTDLDQAVAQSL
jgi:D-alanine-D-alanine ligase-like ATP-grasp enzyme